MTFSALHTLICGRFLPFSGRCRRDEEGLDAALQQKKKNAGCLSLRHQCRWSPDNLETRWRRQCAGEQLDVVVVSAGTDRSLPTSVTLGKATVLQPPRLPPSSSSPSSPSSSSPPLKSALTSRRTPNSFIRWRTFRLSGLPIMHIRTTKCNRFCLVASVTNQEVFHRPEAKVRWRPFGGTAQNTNRNLLRLLNPLPTCWKRPQRWSSRTLLN